jgi:hypothetical protein
MTGLHVTPSAASILDWIAAAVYTQIVAERHNQITNLAISVAPCRRNR